MKADSTERLTYIFLLIGLLIIILNCFLLPYSDKNIPLLLGLYLNLFLGVSISAVACVRLRLIKKNLANNLNTANHTHIPDLSILLKTALDNMEAAVYLRDANLNIIYFNPHYVKIALGEDKIIDIDGIEIDKQAKDSAKLAQVTGKKQVSERYIALEGQRCYYQFIDHYIPETNQVCSIAYDITGKALVTKELELNINSQKRLIESSNNAIVIFDADRRIKYYNQAYVKLWQLDEAYLESSPRYEDILDKLYQERKTSEHSNFLKFKQGRVRLFSTLTDTYNDLLYLPDNRLLKLIIVPHPFGGLLLSFEDVTDHFALQQAYNTLLKVQHTTLNSLQESICVFGGDGAITLHNSKFRELWQLDIEFLNSNPTIFELVEHYKYLISEEDLINHRNNIVIALQERKAIEECIRRLDNQSIKRHIVPLPDGATMISELKPAALVE